MPPVAAGRPLLARTLVEVERLVPAPHEVREHPHVVEDDALPVEVAELLVCGERERRVDGLVVAAERRERPVEDEVRMGECFARSDRLAFLDRAPAPRDGVLRAALTDANPGIQRAEACTLDRGLRAAGLPEDAEPARDPAECLGIVAYP